MNDPFLVSIELTNQCSKVACRKFGCYAKAEPKGATFWTAKMLAPFIEDLADSGIEAVSFGGGEPLQYRDLWSLLDAIGDIKIFKSMTTNGLYLSDVAASRLVDLGLNKVHVSIHFPEDKREVERVISQVKLLETKGLRSGINFIVKGWDVEAEKEAARTIKAAGIKEDRVVFLPLRGKGLKIDAGSVKRFKEVAEMLSPRFQAPWCLLACRKSPRFISIDWEGKVGYCSYTESKTRMAQFTYTGMMEALRVYEQPTFCG